MNAHDRHLAGYSKHPVNVTCQECGDEYVADEVSEYGQAWLEPEECPNCGASGDSLSADPLDEQDIEEMKLRARGIDF